MFLEEQKAHYSDVRPEFRQDFLEKHVWSPTACRFTSWTYLPLCKNTPSGKIVRGSRQRCPFILTEQP